MRLGIGIGIDGNSGGGVPVDPSAAQAFLADDFGQYPDCIAAYMGQVADGTTYANGAAIPDFSPTGVDAVARGSQTIQTAYVSSPADPPDLANFSGFLRTRFIERADTNAFDFGTTGSFTVMVWFKTTPVGGLQFICDTRGAAAGDGFFCTVSGTALRFDTRSGGSNSTATTSSGVFSSDTWTHAAFVRDTSGTRQKIYTNGVQRINQAVTARDVSDAGSLVIGQNPSSISSPFGAFEDELALFSIYDTNVSAANIAAQYTAQRGLFGV